MCCFHFHYLFEEGIMEMAKWSVLRPKHCVTWLVKYC